MKLLLSLFTNRQDKSNRFRIILFIVSVLVVSREILIICSTVGLFPVDYLRIGTLCLLVLLIPLKPVPLSIVVIALSVVFGLDALPEYDTEWISDATAIFAYFVLGSRLGTLKRSCIAAIALTISVLALNASHCDELYQYCEVAWQYSFAWLIGALANHALQLEYQYAVAQERADYRENQLRMLHVLHDNVANDLVYVIMQCRLAQSSCGTSKQEVKGANRDIEQIQHSLEQTLAELRSSVIVPMKDAVSDANIEKSAGVQHSPAIEEQRKAETSLRETIQSSSEKLRQFGFIGNIEFENNHEILTAEEYSDIEMCITELSANIIKHGTRGGYVIAVTAGNEHIQIISSNQCDGLDDERSTQFGLDLLRSRIVRRHGKINTVCEAGEWSVLIEIPRRDNHGSQ